MGDHGQNIPKKTQRTVRSAEAYRHASETLGAPPQGGPEACGFIAALVTVRANSGPGGPLVREERFDRRSSREPYLLYERDRHEFDPIGLWTIDRGIFSANDVLKRHPLPKECTIDPDEYDDPRRLRAAGVMILERALRPRAIRFWRRAMCTRSRRIYRQRAQSHLMEQQSKSAGTTLGMKLSLRKFPRLAARRPS